MSILRKTVLAIAAAACSCAAAAAPTYANATVAGRSSPLLPAPAEENMWRGDALTYVFAAIDREPGSAEDARAVRTFQATVGIGEGAPRQSVPAQRNPLSTNLRGDSDLFLWNLVALVHAQQVNRSFDLVEINLTAFLPATNVVSQVPLPGALWLFGAGLIGLAAPARRRLAAQLRARPAAGLA